MQSRTAVSHTGLLRAPSSSAFSAVASLVPTFICAPAARCSISPSLSCLLATTRKQHELARPYGHSAPRSQARRPRTEVTPAGRYEPVIGFKRAYDEFQWRPDRRRQWKRFWVTVGTGTVVFGGYYMMHLETVPLTGRRRFLDVTPRQEEAMAKAAYQEVMVKFGHSLVHPSHPYVQLVRKVARKLVQVSGMQELDWEVYVVASPQRNAFVLPGGKVFVFTGILPICADEEGLAAVLGHEIAHQLARHSAEKLSFMKIMLLLQIIVGFFIDPGLIFNRLILDLGMLLPFSRKCEVEADQIGLMLMAQACYDPKAAVAVWQRMAVCDKSEPLQYISTHPGHKTRIRNIMKWLPDAEKRREESDCSAELYDLATMFRVLNGPRW